MIEIKVSGNFNKTNSFLERLKRTDYLSSLDKYGKMGVDALRIATPKDTGLTASSWSYEIIQNGESTKIVWKNSNLTETGIPIVILLQYGHATGEGGYVRGRDFINPALKPIFDEIAEGVWKEVSKS